MGLLALVLSDEDYFVVDELDRPVGKQIVVHETHPLHDTYWHVYQGGPFVYEEITQSSKTDDECFELGANSKPTPFADGEYTLTTDERGRDVLAFTVDSPHCDNGGSFELVLPD